MLSNPRPQAGASQLQAPNMILSAHSTIQAPKIMRTFQLPTGEKVEGYITPDRSWIQTRDNRMYSFQGCKILAPEKPSTGAAAGLFASPQLGGGAANLGVAGIDMSRMAVKSKILVTVGGTEHEAEMTGMEREVLVPALGRKVQLKGRTYPHGCQYRMFPGGGNKK